MPYSLTEEPIDRARRHVLQAERIVAHQTTLAARLRNRGYLNLAAQAESVLNTLTTSLTLACEDVAQLEGGPTITVLERPEPPP